MDKITINHDELELIFIRFRDAFSDTHVTRPFAHLSPLLQENIGDKGELYTQPKIPLKSNRLVDNFLDEQGASREQMGISGQGSLTCVTKTEENKILPSEIALGGHSLEVFLNDPSIPLTIVDKPMVVEKIEEYGFPAWIAIDNLEEWKLPRGRQILHPDLITMVRGREVTLGFGCLLFPEDMNLKLRGVIKHFTQSLKRYTDGVRIMSPKS